MHLSSATFSYRHTMNSSEQFPTGGYTAQELMLFGSVEFGVGAKMRRPYTPVGLLLNNERPSVREKNPELSLPMTPEELNELRQQAGYFKTTLSMVLTGKDTSVLSFAPLDRRGETIYDPHVYLPDEETGELTLSMELTEKLYHNWEKLRLEVGDTRGDYPSFRRGRMVEGVPITIRRSGTA
jgi:hypothetical protein